MGELTIRRNRGFADNVRMPAAGKTDKTSGAASSRKAAGTGLNVSPTLQQSMVKETDAILRESRRILQSGEAVLSEVKNTLSRIADLVKESSGSGTDHPELQKELLRLQGEIDRMLGSAASGNSPLFLLDAGTNALSGLDALPAWLLRGMAQEIPSAEEILHSLGLDETASGADILAAVANTSLEDNPAAYLSALYLGSKIAGSSSGAPVNIADAARGLQMLAEAVGDGMTPDEALEKLTNGEFTSFEEFQKQFSQGTLPGFQDFLTSLLLDGGNPALADGPALNFDISLLLISMMNGMNFDLTMSLLDLLDGLSLPELEFGATTEVPLDAQAGGAQGAAAPETQLGTPQVSVMRFGDVQVAGRDLSGVSFNETAGVLTLNGSADVVVQGSGQAQPALVVNGSGTVTLQNVNLSSFTVNASESRIVTAGHNVLGEVQMGAGSVLKADGSGTLQIGSIRGNASNAIHLSGGAVVLRDRNGAELGTLAVPVLVSGAASLAAHVPQVRSFEGKPLEPFDILWKTLLPGFGSVSSMALDGKHARMLLANGQHADPARIWMEKGDLTSHGYPAHRLVIQGRSQAGRPMTRYAYLYWNQRNQAFEASDMNPNPFTVTGGEAGLDWVYEETSCTLRILTSQVSAIAGGTGTDAEDVPFSGRIALADRIGTLELALNGVTCRVTEGRAFDLGRENDVTLLLQCGSRNYFESGAGCAGISMGDGTSLRVDCGTGGPGGALTAAGGSGGTGIGRDGGKKQDGHIMIRGGAITGAEKPDGAESVTITGGKYAGKSIADMGSARVLSRMGISLKIGGETVIMPQFRLSANTLRLDGLDVSSKQFAKAAALTLEADKRWVHRLHRVYENMTARMEHSVILANERAGDAPQQAAQDAPVRDSAAAASLLEGMSRAVPLSLAQAMRTHGSRDASEVRRLLRK